MLCYAMLCYAMLCYTILYYTILYYTILYYTILYYTILYYTILYYTILYYTILYYTILYYTILYPNGLIRPHSPTKALLRSPAPPWPWHLGSLAKRISGKSRPKPSPEKRALARATRPASVCIRCEPNRASPESPRSLCRSFAGQRRGFCAMLSHPILCSTLLFSTLLYSTLLSTTLLSYPFFSCTLQYSYLTTQYSATTYYIIPARFRLP